MSFTLNKCDGDELVKILTRLGLRDNPHISNSKRRQITNMITAVYPHPAQVALFRN